MVDRNGAYISNVEHIAVSDTGNAGCLTCSSPQVNFTTLPS